MDTKVWYIVDDASKVGSLQRYYQYTDPIWLPFNADEDYFTGGTPVYVPFGSSLCADKDGSPQDPDVQSLWKSGNFQIFLMLYYEYKDSETGLYTQIG